MTGGPARARTEIPWSAWAVHFYTATGAVMAFLATREAFAGDFRMAFVWLFAALVVDSSDGTLARLAHVHDRLPHFSGEKVDDLVDYLTFVFVPALIVWRADLIPAGWGLAVVAAMLLSSAYGFASADAKTADCFFTGFPSYWNVAALYLLVGRLPASVNAAILLVLAAFVFVRIGYVYPSRTPTLRPLTVTLTAVWGALILAIIISLPNPSRVLVWLSLVFPVYYTVLSFALDVRRKSMPTGALSLALVGLLLWPAAASTQTRLSENIVLVTLDGARWQEVFTGMDESLLRASVASGTDITTLPAHKQFSGATPIERRERLMPFLWRTLLVDHGFIAGDRTAGSLVSVTNRHRFSYPGYSEILTGQAHDDVIKSNDAIRNPFPSVLQFVRRKLQLPASHVATFGSWGVFRAIVESEEGATTVNAGVQAYVSPSPEMQALSAIQSQATPPWDNLRHDAFTFRFAMDYAKRTHPRVLYIAFDETDDWAHDGRYDLVLQALHRADGYLRELWDALQADPQYRDKTTLIVTADHGRGRTTADWRKHGSNVAGADEIWIAVASPDTARRGLWRGHPPLFQNQIAATIASALGLDYREHNPQAGEAIRVK
jgi:phosphatidylserine synthase